MFDIEKLKRTDDLNEIERIYVMGWNDALDAVIEILHRDKETNNDSQEVPESGTLL